MGLFEHYYREGFAKPWRELYYVSDNVTDALGYLDRYEPILPPDKWTGLERRANQES